MAGKINTVFERTEIKYLVPAQKAEAFRTAILGHMQADDYGLTSICNIYYDTENSDLITRSLQMPKYKEKLRLRSYGVPGRDTIVFPEIKKKVNGIVYKRREVLPLHEAEAFLNEGIYPEKDSQIMREIAYFTEHYHPVPKMFIAYDRVAYFGKEDHDFRLTMDTNIRYRTTDLTLSHGDYGVQLDIDGASLVEIKCGHAMPMFMVKILSELEIYPMSFSKYGKIFTEVYAKPAMSGAAAAREMPAYTPVRGVPAYAAAGAAAGAMYTPSPVRAGLKGKA